ncbi:MerR family transcriptional regulator [Bacteroidetes bacterium endosymbiont of Geopemphigus sp.]|uniref:MerR family transcriptional regulator n=1 Tax=Bacteroidetes bacterium endosymbiont of Geopemphigus sp. TaxID=2047937 RepID=UPI000CD0D688|nr:MerR family transcriptional regulator [Bacteroidetes bacterium endosymbiont of Geopemphigus sp.]
MHIEFPDKLYYSIGEIASAFNVNTSLIRFWEKEFDILTPRKNKKGNRCFSKKDIENFKLIYHLVKERGYTLEGARHIIDTNQKLIKEVSVIHRLEAVRAELVRLKDQFEDIS